MSTYNIYCDESCHLENDWEKVMVLGAVWCHAEKARPLFTRIREIKRSYGYPAHFEVKWNKVSPAGLPLYAALVDAFFDEADLNFRALIVPDKRQLDHRRFAQDHDTWYYKMYFELLKALLQRGDAHRIYLDIKDTRSADKVRKLHEVLCNSYADSDQSVIERVQTVQSHEVELIQLADLLIGAVSYANRELTTSDAKLALIDQVRQRSGLTLTQTTRRGETKVNLFRWQASRG